MLMWVGLIWIRIWTNGRLFMNKGMKFQVPKKKKGGFLGQLSKCKFLDKY
jgi:hypothetical protein